MKIREHSELDVYKKTFDAAMLIFELSKNVPRDEIYSLTDQIRRSSRSVCSNLAEAWRKRRYKAAFIAKLSDAEAEAAETQVWICHHPGFRPQMVIFGNPRDGQREIPSVERTVRTRH